MHPFFPLVDDRYCDPVNRGELLSQEPLLCTAILAVTSRYVWPSKLPSYPRAYETHNALFRQVQLNIHERLWGISGGGGKVNSILGMIECIILFIEWVCAAMLSSENGDRGC